jgi:putative resolvase
VVEGAIALGLPISEIVKEVGSGLNGERRERHRVLADAGAAVVVVEHRDRLARFGVEHLESLLSATGRRLVVLNPQESTEDLVRDMTEVVTGMCVRR